MNEFLAIMEYSCFATLNLKLS